MTGADDYASLFQSVAEREQELALGNSLSPVTVLVVYLVEVTSLKSLVLPRSGWQMVGSAVINYSGPRPTLSAHTAARPCPARAEGSGSAGVAQLQGGSAALPPGGALCTLTETAVAAL